MKKLFALLLALCLMWSVACAEESTVNWEDVQAVIESSGLEGDFWNLEDLGLDIWLPNDLQEVEVSEEDAAAGRLALFMPADQSAYLAVDVANVGGMTLDQFFANAQASEAEEVEMIHMNGLDAVVYKDAGNDLWSATLVDTNSNLINFIMGPASEEGSKDVFAIIISSLQPED